MGGVCGSEVVYIYIIELWLESNGIRLDRLSYKPMQSKQRSRMGRVYSKINWISQT